MRAMTKDLILHGDEVLAVDLAELDDLDDVRVLELRAQLGFPDEVGDQLGVVDQLREQALERDLAPHAGAVVDRGAMDDGHPTCAQTLVHLVRSERVGLGDHAYMVASPRGEVTSGSRPASRRRAGGERRRTGARSELP